MFHKKTVKDIDVAGKRILMRGEYDVPFTEFGTVASDYRIKGSLQTIKYLLEKQCSVVIMSHAGRPEGQVNPKLSLEPVAHRLSELLGMEVGFAHDCIGDEVREKSAQLQQGQVLLLENTRFHPEEEQNDMDFARQIVADTGAELFVQENFGVAHRKHASVEAVGHVIPGVAGFLPEREYNAILGAIESPTRPLLTIVGGAKISDKIKILERFIGMSDYVAVIGAMANTFLKELGVPVGKSLVEPEAAEEARRILALAEKKTREVPFTFLLPRDVIVSKAIDGTQPTRVVDLTAHNFADITAYPKKPSPDAYTVAEDELILDIGPMSAAAISGAIQISRTLIWNGTAGVTETKGLGGAADPFGHGSKAILEAVEGHHHEDKNRPFTVVGGGDTVGYVMDHAQLDPETGMPSSIGHVSTGGGASLELMCGKMLPGIEVLQDKEGTAGSGLADAGISEQAA